MRCHEVDYHIVGHDIQMVEIELDPNETVIAEAGAMTYMEQDIDFETKMGDGSGGVMDKLFGLGKRMLTGESVFLTHFSNRGGQKRKVAFSAPFPGSVIPLNLAELGEEVICQRTAFLAAAFGTQVDIAFNKRLGSGFFGGEGFILERLRGDGMAFIHAGGTIVRKDLRNETLRLDTGCLVAFSGDIDYGIAMSGGLKSMLFGGEGLFLATLSGTGSVWVQSMPFSRLAERVLSQSRPTQDSE
ncbi:TIGR00266 family protein [Methylomonas sp. LWB]|uniref:TIGR00266 family protein n=1 Tax=unclassified Methylomonas TaxID=2608980 RepID=UPI0008D9FAE1|nr:TIGR00266 family protein [Methylomonas sp. LWB]NJA07340.1 TIGR00266 family protein [Methylococcaceae bacterium WWC4]OHX36774.1 TIGR00266 family protein [Methylomonas sp. LWB]